MAFDSALQRQIMGRFATGVTVVTTAAGDEVSGMTANAVMSLSLDPPLVVVSVDRQATMHGLLQRGQCFAINILRREQEDLSNRFAQRGPKDFSDLDQFMAEKKARPGGVIAPIPTFKAYEPFAYSATRMRSPFDRPIAVRDIARLAGKNAIKPDMDNFRTYIRRQKIQDVCSNIIFQHRQNNCYYLRMFILNHLTD